MMNTEEELYIKVIKGEHKDNVFQVKNMSDTGMTLEISNSEISRDKVDIEDVIFIGEFYQFNLSSCIRQQNSLTAQFVSFSLSNLANIFYPPNFYNN